MEQEISDLTQPKEAQRLFFSRRHARFRSLTIDSGPPPNEMSGGGACAWPELSRRSSSAGDSRSVLQYENGDYGFEH